MNVLKKKGCNPILVISSGLSQSLPCPLWYNPQTRCSGASDDSQAQEIIFSPKGYFFIHMSI